MNSDIERQREHFNGIADKYFNSRNHPNHLALKELIWKKFFARNSQLKGEIKSVIEPMCGMAEGYTLLQKNVGGNFRYLGFDYSENMVEIARGEHPALSIEWGDVTNFKPSGNPYDMIILIGGLHHVYSRAADVIKNLTYALNPNGYFLSFEPTHNNWFARRARKNIYSKNDLFDNDTEQGFEYKDLSKHFGDAGYERVDEVYPGLLSYILYYNPDAFPALNIGGVKLVNFLFSIDRIFWSNWIGRKFSFATITLWQLKS